MRARILANLNWLLADRILRLIGGLAVGIWVARYLGAGDFGVLSYSIAYVGLFGAFSRLGMDQVVVRELVKEQHPKGAVLGTIFVMKLCAAIISLVVMAVCVRTLGANSGSGTMILIVGLGLLANAADACDIDYQSRTQSRQVVMARSIAFLFFVAVRVSMILHELPVIYFAVAATLELLFSAALIGLVYFRDFGRSMTWTFDGRVALALLKDGWPLLISAALVMLHMRLDQVMIGNMLGPADVGIYNVAVRLSEAWLFVPVLIVQSVTPYLVKLRDTNPAGYEARLTQLYSAMFWLGALAAITAVLVGEKCIVLLFGQEYRNAYVPLILTIWTGGIIAQTVARGLWLVAENLQGYRLVSNLIAVPLNIALNITLIPHYGIVGASVASLVSVTLGAWAFPFLFRSMRASNLQMLKSINPKHLFYKP